MVDNLAASITEAKRMRLAKIYYNKFISYP